MRKTGKSGEPWYIYNWMSFTWPFLLGTVFFQTALLWSGGYHMERGGMPLHAVGMNCKKKHNYWKTRLRCQVYGLRGVSWWLCERVCVVWLDMTTPPGGRKSWYMYYNITDYFNSIIENWGEMISYTEMILFPCRNRRNDNLNVWLRQCLIELNDKFNSTIPLAHNKTENLQLLKN